MIIVKRCRWFTGVFNFLSHNTYSSLKLLNHTAVDFKPCTMVHTFSVVYNKYYREVNPNVQRPSLLRIEDNSTHVKLTNLQQKRCLNFAAKLVNNSSPKVQPYMKLMRIDRPIGKIDLSDCSSNYLLYYD